MSIRSTTRENKVGEEYTRRDILYHQVIAEEEEREAEESQFCLDELFPYVGEYGKYQKLLTFLVILPACIPCGLQGFNQIFMSNPLPFSCKIPLSLLQLNTNLSEAQLRHISVFKGQNETNSCFVRNIDWAELFNKSFKSHAQAQENYNNYDLSENEHDFEMGFSQEEVGEENEVNFENSLNFEEIVEEIENLGAGVGVVPCPNGWEYEGDNSIVKDFDLVCGKEIYPTIALLLVNLGGLFGVFIFGWLSDIIGRKWSFFVCLAFEMIGGIGCVFTTDFWSWTLFRVIVGFTVPAIYQIPFIICLELVGPNYRAFVTVMTSFFYVGGMMILPLISYLEPNWKLLSLYTTVPFLVYFIFIWLMPESPRWLLAQGRGKDALKILEHLAKVNGKVIPPQIIHRISLSDRHHKAVQKKRGESKKGVLDLFRLPNMRLKTILLTLCWFSNCTCYVGLSYYGSLLGSNPHLNFFLSSAVELPGYLICWLLMDRLGRRLPLSLAMIIGGTFDIGTLLLSPEESPTLLLLFFLAAKLGISASYLIIYPFAGELYPTELRGVGLGFSAYVGGIGLSLIPLINYLGHENPTLPLLIMGILSVVGGVAGLRLPETLNSPLPQTVEDGEEFGKNITWLNCLYHSNGQMVKSEEEGGVELKVLQSGGDEEEGGLKINEGTSSRRKKFVRQGSTLEAPSDSTGAFIITPWWVGVKMTQTKITHIA